MVWATGCAAATPPVAGPDRAVLEAQAQSRRIAALETENRAHTDRIRQLEGQLALARAEVEELRGGSRVALADTVRIGAPTERAPDAVDWVDTDGVAVSGQAPPQPPAAAPEDEGAPRPVLRLYGSPAASLEALAPAGAEPIPLRAADTVPPIPLVPVTPAAPAAPAPAPASAQRPPSEARASEAAVERYRLALGHVQGQRLAEALAALTGFLNEFPSHPYADNALYWRGEVEYALRHYPEALRDFQRLVREHPRGNKVPDALLKMGLCHLRMGDTDRARAYFRRVRNEYPDSVAARLASQEDAS